MTERVFGIWARWKDDAEALPGCEPGENWLYSGGLPVWGPRAVLVAALAEMSKHPDVRYVPIGIFAFGDDGLPIFEKENEQT